VIPIPSEQQQALYRPAFAHNCLLLIVRAHETLEAGSLQSAEEPHITGLLVKRAKELAETDDAEPWLEHLEIIDYPPQNDVPDRLGKARPRIDIEFVRTGRGKRPRFHVEAKRLYRSDSVSEYFGGGGLEMFLNGTYASQWPSVGMLGYVQSDNSATWLDGLARGFSSRKNKLSVCGNQSNWRSAGWTSDGLTEVQESCHDRIPQTLGKVEIYHLLLEFLRSRM
jgi:hypothetical protein